MVIDCTFIDFDLFGRYTQHAMLALRKDNRF